MHLLSETLNSNFQIKSYFYPHFLFQSDVTQNSTTATCSGGGTTAPSFQTPNPWPTCVAYLNCTAPPIDPLVMIYDWADAKLTMPGLNVKLDLKYL